MEPFNGDGKVIPQANVDEIFICDFPHIIFSLFMLMITPLKRVSQNMICRKWVWSVGGGGGLGGAVFGFWGGGVGGGVGAWWAGRGRGAGAGRGGWGVGGGGGGGLFGVFFLGVGVFLGGGVVGGVCGFGVGVGGRFWWG